MNDLFLLVDFSPVGCFEICSRDDSICLNSILKRFYVWYFLLVDWFECMLLSRFVTRALQENCILYFFLFISHFYYFTLWMSYFLWQFFIWIRNCFVSVWFFVVVLFSVLFFFFLLNWLGFWNFCLNCAHIGKIVARSDWSREKTKKIKATKKWTKRNKRKWNKHTVNINVVQNYRFALNNFGNLAVLLHFLPSDLRSRKNISHFHQIGIEKLLSSHFENWVCMMWKEWVCADLRVFVFECVSVCIAEQPPAAAATENIDSNSSSLMVVVLVLVKIRILCQAT